jgi:hypothetical protein
MHGLTSPVFATAASAGGIVMFVRGFLEWNERRLIQNTPTARIRSMAMGLVEIEGTVEPRSVLAAPFSGHDCAYWQVDISTRTKDGWNVVHKNSSHHPFYLRDDTGVALIYPEGGECKVAFGVEEVCNGPFLPDCYSEYIKSEHLTLVSLMSAGQMRFRERVMQTGQRAFVLGSAMPRARAVNLSDGEAMEATGTDGPQNRIAATDREVAAVVRRGQNETTFIISQESARVLTLDLGIRAVAQLVGGPVLSLCGLGWWLFVLSAGQVNH